MRAVVTGSSGFIGSRVVDRLRAQGWTVDGLDLRPDDGSEPVDVAEAGAWQQRLAGADLVVHTAAVVGEQAPDAAYWQVNVTGTAHVLDACEAGEVGRLLHLSSIVVHGRDFVDGVAETGPVRPTGNPYTDTKIASEHQVVTAHAAGRVRATVVRPGDVYGPGSVQWTVRPVRMMQAGQFVLVDGGRGVLSPVYVEDLVDGVLAAAGCPAAVGRIFHVTGGVGVSCAEFFGRYAALLGVHLRSVPPSVARAAVTPLRLARLVGRTPPMTARTLEYVTHPGTYSIDAVRQVVGWRPQYDLDAGMRLTARWLRDTGLLD